MKIAYPSVRKLITLSIIYLLLILSLNILPSNLSADTSIPGLGVTESEGPKESLNPSRSLERFLKATSKGEFKTAAEFVVLPANLSEAERDKKLVQIAKTINELAVRTPLNLSEKDSGVLDDGYAPNQELLTKVTNQDGRSVEVFLQRSQSETHPAYSSWWIIPNSEVKKLLLIGKLTSDSFKIETLFPLWLNYDLISGLTIRGLLSFLTLLSAAHLVAYLVRSLVVWLMILVNRQLRVELKSTFYPLQLLLGWYIFSSNLHLLELTFTTRQTIDRIVFLITVVTLYWFLVIAIDLISTQIRTNLLSAGKTNALPLLPLVQRVCNVIFGLGLALYLINGLGFDITALLAGLGVGGIAVALASQKTIENLFGGLVLFLDQPVAVGQFGKFGNLSGTIEDIGIRSTKIRTIQRTRVSIPNAELIQMSIENFTVRDQILLNKLFTLRHDLTNDQLIFFLAGVRRLLISHERVALDGSRVRAVDILPTGIVIEIYCYIDTSEWAEFLAIQEDLLLRLLTLAKESGVYFASSVPQNPSDPQQDHSVALAAKEVATKEVQNWKNTKKIPLPDLPAEEIVKSRGKIEYPDKHAWLRNQG